MAHYRLTSVWHLDATPEAVWEAISRIALWTHWWPDVVSARVLDPGDATGLGRRTRLVYRSPLGYRLRFEVLVTRSEAPRIVQARAVGQLEGTGTWELYTTEAGVRAVNTWDVETRRWWTGLLSPVAAPIFRWSHAAVMRRGERGLARQLAASGYVRPQ